MLNACQNDGVCSRKLYHARTFHGDRLPLRARPLQRVDVHAALTISIDAIVLRCCN